MLFVVVFLLLMSSNEVLAQGQKEVDLSWVKALNQQVLELSKKPNEEVHQIVEQAHSQKGCSSAQRIVRNARGILGFKDQNSENRYPDLLVFVSFSMPLETLKGLNNQVKQHGGKLVFRGLVDGSFKKMGAKLQELGAEVLIDPTLFERHGVTHVPTFIKDTDRLVGNVSLDYVLHTFAQESRGGAS